MKRHLKTFGALLLAIIFIFTTFYAVGCLSEYGMLIVSSVVTIAGLTYAYINIYHYMK